MNPEAGILISTGRVQHTASLVSLRDAKFMGIREHNTSGRKEDDGDVFLASSLPLLKESLGNDALAVQTMWVVGPKSTGWRCRGKGVQEDGAPR